MKRVKREELQKGDGKLDDKAEDAVQFGLPQNKGSDGATEEDGLRFVTSASPLNLLSVGDLLVSPGNGKSALFDALRRPLEGVEQVYSKRSLNAGQSSSAETSMKYGDATKAQPENDEVFHMTEPNAYFDFSYKPANSARLEPLPGKSEDADNTEVFPTKPSKQHIVNLKRTAIRTKGQSTCPSCSRERFLRVCRGPDGPKNLCMLCGHRYSKLNRTPRTRPPKAGLTSSEPPPKSDIDVSATGRDYPPVLSLKPDPGFEEGRTKSEKTSTFWDHSPTERRKLQNQIAQRNYRSKLRQKHEGKGQHERLEKSELAGGPYEDGTVFKLEENTIDPEVLAYQDPNESVIIECLCGNADDRRFIIPCVTCGKWQHITCYYELAQEVVDGHECIQCNPRRLEDSRSRMLKRSVDMDLHQDAGSSATPSHKRPRTAGVESSNNLSDSAQALLLASKSNYQNILEGTHAPGVHYPASNATSLTSIWINHKLAKNRVKVPATTEISDPEASSKEGDLPYLKQPSAYINITFLPQPQPCSMKRSRATADIDGENSCIQKKKRRLRLLFTTSRLSPQFSYPATNIVDRGSSKIAVWAKQKSLGQNLLCKAAILNYIRRRASVKEMVEHERKQGDMALALAKLEFNHGSVDTYTADKLGVHFLVSGSPTGWPASTRNPSPTLALSPPSEAIECCSPSFRSPNEAYEYASPRAQLPKRGYLILPPSPLSLSNYDAFHADEDVPDPYSYLDDDDDEGTTYLFEDDELLDTLSRAQLLKKDYLPLPPPPLGLSDYDAFDDDQYEFSITMEDAREDAAREVQIGLFGTLKVLDQPDEPSKVLSEEDTDVLLDDLPEANMLPNMTSTFYKDEWNVLQDLLPEHWKWDVEFQSGCWTCTPLEPDDPKHYPLTIGGAPVVLSVEHQWPPMSGVNPPPDPRPSGPIDCQTELSLGVVRDLFMTFEGSIGFYVLINGLLQILVPEDFDTAWASSHLPHKYGGLKVCYIPQTLEGTMLPSTIETNKPEASLTTQTSSLSSMLRQSRSTSHSSNPSLKLNDFIEARPKSKHRKDKYSGRIGLKVVKYGEPYLLMSTHIITEAIMAKSHRSALFRSGRDPFDRLDENWNEHVEIWAGNERVGEISQSFDCKAHIYPDGFHHDVTLIKPKFPSSVKDIASPITDLGWLNRGSWNSLRQQTSKVRILGAMENHRSAKSIKCSRPSEILVVGEGIFLNQTAAAGSSRSLKDHDITTWEKLISRAILYRVYPDFDPPNGYSGVALYAQGTRQDGTEGPGIVGFQSFVQRSGHVQNFNMEGPALEKRLQLGRVAFYGAFEVPEELKQEYTIV